MSLYLQIRRLRPRSHARLMHDGHRLVAVRETTHCPRATDRSGGQSRRRWSADVAVAVQRTSEPLAEVGRQERVDDRIHARVGVRQRMRADPEVVEGVRVAPRRRRIVGPQPDDVRREPAEAEDRDDDDDETRDLPLHPQPLVVSPAAASPDGVQRFPDEPQLADHQRTKHEDGDKRNDVADDEKNEVVRGSVPHGATPVVGADRDRFRSDVPVDSHRVEDRPGQRDQHGHQPDDDSRRQRHAGRPQVFRLERVADG